MRLIKHIKASNLLSFGPDGLDLELHDLNVLIGANGSGKSNFLEILDLLRGLPSERIQNTIARGGGLSEWIWKGADENSVTQMDILIDNPLSETPLRHQFKISSVHDRFYLANERITDEGATGEMEGVYFYYQNVSGVPVINSKDHTKQLVKKVGTILPGVSILSQLQDPDVYPEFFHIAQAYKKISLYREWSVGRKSKIRISQNTDLRNDRLEEDFSNLNIFLSRLRKEPNTKKALIAALQDLYQGLDDFEIVTEGGTVQIFFTEGDFSVPATRLSDGTLRYLCLLALLLDPTPPPLICIEEPELGLHPDVLPKIADLLIDASKRTQLIVTTHSDVLVDALSEQPESVLVCEKHDGKTTIKRLERSEVAHWLEDYRLGQLWIRGEIGGTRW